jgi:hypothetical protein
LTFALATSGLAQKTIRSDSSSNSSPSYAIPAVGFGVGLTAIHFARYVPLWDSYKTSFFVRENPTYASNYDKFLHFYGGVVGADVIASGFQLQGLEKEEAVILGTAASSLLYLFIEVEDAHISYLGFDRVDFVTSVAGSGYPLLQYYVPFFNSVTPKFSYKSSGINTRAANQYSLQVLSDHEGQTFWLGMTASDFLPKKYQQSYPRWLGAAVGYSMRNLGQNARQEYYLTLDVDLRMIDTHCEFLNTVLRTLNYIHFPMPGVKISHGKPALGIYF